MKRKETIRNVVKLVLVYVIFYFCATIIFIGLFHTELLNGIDVLMYRGVVFIILSSGMAAVLMGICRYVWHRNHIAWKDVILLFVGCCCVNMVFFTLVPVTVERSVSVFMLSYMEENAEKSYTKEDVEEIFVQKYINDYGAFDKRFHEQIVTGTIEEKSDGTYGITKQGKQIVGLFRIIAEWFDTDRRLVYPNNYK